MSDEQSNLSVGSKLGSYEIKELLGTGETGEVYRVLDPRRAEEVALKRLPKALSRDTALTARFLHYVEILRGLSHPAIASLHGFEEIGDERILTMELTEGRSLSARLSDGALSTGEAVTIMCDVAGALEHAHWRRLVHGHLRPEDIKISESGVVKVYDFGLTRTIETLEPGEAGLKQQATVERPSRGGSEANHDAAYLSPEQMQGKLDERTDLWSLGIILWEMLTGGNPFLRSTISATSQAVVKEELDWSLIPEEVPPHVRRALQLSLQKRPSMRIRNAADFAIEITTPFDQWRTVRK